MRLVRERERNGEDPVKVVGDAIEIGARVLDREQAAANAEYVKTEFERAARQLDKEFTDKARTVAEHFGSKVDEVFGPENGRLAQELDKLFSDGSATAVQHRVRELVAESLTKSREDLVRQFSAADGSNPLAEFKAGTIRVLRQADERQHQTQQALLERLAGLERQLQGLRDEKDKLEAVEAERERGTAKGRTFEEHVAEAIDAVAVAQGDVAEAVGDLRGATGKTGDVVVAIDACNGPAARPDRVRGQGPAAVKAGRAGGARQGDGAARGRLRGAGDPGRGGAAGQAAAAARVQRRQADRRVRPTDGSRLSLEVAYRLARARVLMSRTRDGGVDPSAVHDLVERALAAMEDVRKVKNQLTGARTNIDRAYGLVEIWPTGCGATSPRSTRSCSARQDEARLPRCATIRWSSRTARPRRPRTSAGAALGQQQVVVGVRPLLADRERRRGDLLRHGLGRAGAHLVVAGGEVALERGRVRGAIGPTCSRTDPPSSVTVWRASVWLAIVIEIGPAPTFAGETVTPSSWITPLSTTATGGRGLFSKLSSPQAPSSTPNVRTTAAARATRSSTAANLPHAVARRAEWAASALGVGERQLDDRGLGAPSSSRVDRRASPRAAPAPARSARAAGRRRSRRRGRRSCRRAFSSAPRSAGSLSCSPRRWRLGLPL